VRRHDGGANAANAGCFNCPDLNNGGLPPANPTLLNMDPNQTYDPALHNPPTNTYQPDLQVPRISYTLNEAICGRGKMVIGFQSCVRNYQGVNASEVRPAGQTILATEFPDNWKIISDVSYGSSATAVLKSHRPVHAWKTDGQFGNAGADMEKAGSILGLNRRVTVDDLDSDVANHYLNGQWTSSNYKTRLDWIGHNHGHGTFAKKLTNFLYVDGHVETKSVADTVTTWEWGQKFWSMANQNNFVYNN